MYYEGCPKRTCDNEIYLPYTIEQQLEAYTKHPQKTERHEILYHTWYQNKKWLTTLLETTIIAYTNYSRHDASHAESVIHNIERILGEDRIRMLSPTDCFLLLHVAYIHDIGMYITAEDRRNMVESDEFDELLDRFEKSSDYIQKKWAECVRKVCYEEFVDASGNRKLYRKKLDVYHAITNILTEFYRSEHGERSEKRLIEWTAEPTRLGSGFSMSGIPMRIFYRIAECSGLHTSYDFKKILELPREDSGFAHDMMHPRFAAVLLQLGDALDMDNNRFHPLVSEIVGELPQKSKVHFEKHAAIRTLKITPNEITIEADCKTIEVLREIRKECQEIEDLLRVAGYYWSKIMPPNFVGSLPTLNISKLLCGGLNIPQELVNARFDISKEKALGILEGSNVYDDYFPFLRELIQNAVDAAKLQFWSDYSGSVHYQRNISGDEDFRESTFDIMKNFSTLDYPIEIYLTVKAIDQYNNFIDCEDRELLERLQKTGELDYGVLVEVQDHGIGISKEDIESISKVGESHSKKQIVEKMPHILRPTGAFGIGLQSVFAVTSSFKCQSKTHKGECYEFTFSSPSRKNEGQINAQALTPNAAFPYGTKFEVFVTREQKIDHHRFLRAWAGVDPFADDYDSSWKLHEAEELMTQMVYYIRDLLGEKIFPICVIANDPFSQELPYNLQQQVIGNDSIVLKVWTKGAQRTSITKEELKRTLSWAFRYNRSEVSVDYVDNKEIKFDTYGVLQGEDRFYFDINDFKLKIWCEKAKAFACLSASRILEKYISEDEKKGKIRLCYKGIEVCFFDGYNGDFNLIESIDMKEEQTAEILLLNRDQLTPKGRLYINENVVPEVLQTAQRVYKFISEKILSYYYSDVMDCFEKKRSDFLGKIESVLSKMLNRQLYKVVDFSQNKEKDMKNEKLLNLLGKSAKEVFHEEIMVTDLLEIVNTLKKREIWYTDIPTECLEEFIRKMKGQKKEFCSISVQELIDFLYELEKEEQIFSKNKFIFKSSASVFQVEDAKRENTLKVMSLIFLVYHAKSSGFNKKQTVVACMDLDENKECPWECILECIGKLLDGFFYTGKLKEEYGGILLSKELLYVQVISEGNGWNFEEVSLAEILSNKDRYCIYSEREQRNLEWRHWLKRMKNNEVSNIDIKSLETFLILRERDRYNVSMYHSLSDNLRYTDYVGKWMLYNIPTEMFVTRISNEQDPGNQRLNLLSIKSNMEVKLNDDIRYLLLKKMQERRKRYTAKRFSTVLWDGMKCLKVTKVPHTVCEVNRGYVSEMSKPKMILPFSSECVEEMLNLYREQSGAGKYEPTWRLDSSFVNKLEKVSVLYKNFLAVAINPYGRSHINDLLQEQDKKIRFEGGYTYEDFMNLKSEEKKYSRLFSTLQDKFPMYNTKSESDLPEEEVDFSILEFNNVLGRNNSTQELIKLLAFVRYGLSEVLESHFFNKAIERQFVFKQMGKNKYDIGHLKPDVNNLINYVTKYGDMKPSYDQVEGLYYKIYDELFSSIKSIEKRIFEGYLKDLGLI